MKKMDITGEKFDFVDTSEGNIFFDSFSEGEGFRLKVWGITLMHELGITEKDTYIAALSNIEFDDVIYICMDYGIYANEQGTEFINDGETDSTNMRLELGKKQTLNGYKEYILGGIIGRNIGYAEITIICRGKIKLIFDESALVNATDFCLYSQQFRMNY